VGHRRQHRQLRFARGARGVGDLRDGMRADDVLPDTVPLPTSIGWPALDFITKVPYLEDKLEISVEKVERI
jgi:hypothetical protein